MKYEGERRRVFKIPGSLANRRLITSCSGHYQTAQHTYPEAMSRALVVGADEALLDVARMEHSILASAATKYPIEIWQQGGGLDSRSSTHGPERIDWMLL